MQFSSLSLYHHASYISWSSNTDTVSLSPGPLQTTFSPRVQDRLLTLSCHTLAHSLIQSLTFSVQFSSVAQSCPTLCGHMNCSAPGFLVHHQLLEFIQLTSVDRVGDAIQPSHSLSSTSTPAPNLSQHQSLFL